MDIIPASPLIDPVSHRLGYLLRRASAAMMADLAHTLSSCGISPVEATVLVVIGANPGCTQSDIARLLGIKRANMVPIIARLGAEGWVERRPMNGRSHALHLTEAGMGVHNQAELRMNEQEERFSGLLQGQDAAALRAALALLVRTPEE